MPETAYYGPRPSTTNETVEEAFDHKEHNEGGSEKPRLSDPEVSLVIQKQSYLQSLKPWSTPNPYVSLKNCFLRPFILCT